MKVLITGVTDFDRIRSKLNCPTTIRTFTQPEAAWLASAIDGEGSLNMYQYKGGRSAIIVVYNTIIAYVNKAKEIIGSGTVTRHIKEKGRKDVFRYSMKGSGRCYQVIKQIIPYLIIKKERAEAIVDTIENTPFGLESHRTKEYRKKASNRVKKEWKNARVRLARIAGMKNAKKELQNV
jgi:GH15 family glucan-1,4-alpha-glucosidase